MIVHLVFLSFALCYKMCRSYVLLCLLCGAMLVMLDLDLKHVSIFVDHALMFPYMLYLSSMHVLRGSIG